ncbi:MAG: glycosyltransferase family 39 protein [Anaerolineae bacterium]|nr:glycosyltransferase family 39 protein [Anaerolineae bacterium]
MPATRHTRTWTWGAVLLLLIFWLSRLHNLLALPIFLDEASHITRAQWVWEGRPLYLLETGKALAPYLASLFWPFAGAPFIGRFVVVLIGAIGLASVYAVGRELHSRQAGVLAMALWISAPQLMFFERMALVDTTISSMAMLTLWLAIRMMRSGRERLAVWCGVGLALCVFAKTTGIVFFPIPVLVALCVNGRICWRKRINLILTTYAVAAALLIAPILYIRSANADPTGVAYGLTSVDSHDLIQRVQANVAQVWNAELVYFSRGMLAVVLLAALFGVLYVPRISLLLLALAAAPLGAVIATAVSLWLRYISPATPFLLLLTAILLLSAADMLRKRLSPRIAYTLPWLVAGAWALLVGIPFHLTAYNTPADLNLPEGDVVEYIQWIPSGFGIREAVQYLQTLDTKPITVISTAVNCNAARLYLPLDSNVKMICPDIDWGGGNTRIMYAIQDYAEFYGQVYVLSEEGHIIYEYELPRPLTVLQEWARPGGAYEVKLYRISSNTVSPTP